MSGVLFVLGLIRTFYQERGGVDPIPPVFKWVPAWSWYVWAILALATLLIGTLEGSYRIDARRREALAPKPRKLRDPPHPLMSEIDEEIKLVQGRVEAIDARWGPTMLTNVKAYLQRMQKIANIKYPDAKMNIEAAYGPLSRAETADEAGQKAALHTALEWVLDQLQRGHEFYEYEPA